MTGAAPSPATGTIGALTPRAVAGLLATPACERRARLVRVLDHVAVRLGASVPHQSPFALARSAQFASRLAADGHAAVLELIREHLRLDVDLAPGSDLAACIADPRPRLHLLAPLRLPFAGGHLETGPLMLVSGSSVHVVDTRTYASLDGQADPGKVSATSREIAVLVAALRRGCDRVSPVALLVLPRDFGLVPVAARVDVTPQLARVMHLRLPTPAPAEAVGTLPPRFGDGCTDCSLFDHCAAEQAAAGSVARLGDAVANLCGPDTPVTAALADPPPDHPTRLRLRAYAERRAVPKATVRHDHIGRPLVVTGYHLAGDPAAVLALRYGTAQDDEKLLVVVDPRDREQRMAVLREFAVDVTAYVDGFAAVTPVVRRDLTVVECAVDAPQLIMPNHATAAWITDLLGRYLRGSGDPASQLGGLHLGWFAGRRMLPGSSAVLAATALLANHWATGRLAAEDGHLATLLHWIDAEVTPTDRPAGPVSDPHWDASVLLPSLRGESGAGRSARLNSVHPVREAVDAELRPAWQDTWRAIDLLRTRLPAPGEHVAERWEQDRWSFTGHRARVADGTATFAARLHGVPAYRFLHELETRTVALERQMALDDPLVMAAYVISGTALTGTVAKVDTDHTITSASGRDLLRPRVWLTTTGNWTRPVGTELWLATDPTIMVTVEAVDLDNVELLVRKGAVRRQSLHKLPAAGQEVVFAPFGGEDVFPSRLPERLPWQFGIPDAGE